MTVKITFSPEAAAALTSKLGDRKVVLLALNDGSNQYSLQGGTCTIGASFQFVLLDEKDPTYNIKLADDLGLDLYTADAEMGFLDDNLSVGAKYGMLSLSGDSGLIDSAVKINRYVPSALTAEQVKNGVSC